MAISRLMEVKAVCGQSLLIKVDGLQILVDTPLEFVGLLSVTPRCLHAQSHTQTLSYDTSLYDTVDSETLDVVLVSNLLAVQGLPLLFPKCHARVLMTDPVSKLGPALCEEMIALDEDIRTTSLDCSRMYSPEEIPRAWTHVQALSYRQVVRINEIEIEALSAGHSLGSANWRITWGDFSVVVVGCACADNSRYPAELDLLMLNADVLLFGPRVAPLPTPFQTQMKQFYEVLLETCRSNALQSVVMLPLNPMLFLDLQSRLVSASAAFHLPIFCVSRTTKAFCSCAAGSTEWLNNELKHKSYIPQSAFPFETALENKSLRIYKDLKESFGSDFKEPCILLAGHASLRLGEGEYLLSYLANQARSSHTLLFVDPEYPMELCIAPFRTANWTRKLKLVQSEIRVGLTVQEIREMVGRSGAVQTVLPETFAGCLGEIEGKRVDFYSSDDPIPLRKDRPTNYSFKCVNEAKGVVFGSLDYTNYQYTVELVSVAEAVKAGLEELGVSAEVEERNEVLVVRAKDGRVELSPRGVAIRAKSGDFRKVLLQILKSKRRRDP